MAETKTSISELTAATAVAATDLLFVSQQSGSAWNSRKATVGQLSSAIGLGNYSLTSHTHSDYSLTSHTHSQYLTAVPSTYKTYSDTKTQLQTDGFKTYAATLSSLSSTYSLTSHTHSQYSLTSHNHSGVYANATHAHGNIQSGGTLQTTDVAIANGDKLVVTDADGSNKVARTSLAFDGSTTTQFLSKKGTWETALTAHQSLTGYVSKAELKSALSSVGQIPGGDGANLENTIAKFNALFSALSALTD